MKLLRPSKKDTDPSCLASKTKVLQQVMERGKFMGMSVSGPHGRQVRIDQANPFTPVSHALPAQHGWLPSAWPYQEEEFSRMDERPDDQMYAEPRLAEHLDLNSLQNITDVYEAVFKACADGFKVLDLCSSWNSHYPAEIERASQVPQSHIMSMAMRRSCPGKVAVHGLNSIELEMNEVATERHVQDEVHGLQGETESLPRCKTLQATPPPPVKSNCPSAAEAELHGFTEVGFEFF
eukprot:Skav212615  [mRNA]  locus=scaffold2176:297899:300665:- [translate_table: standard]